MADRPFTLRTSDLAPKDGVLVDPAIPLNGKNGFTVIDTRDVIKTFMLAPVAVGDVNGDGIGDVIISYYDDGLFIPHEPDPSFPDEVKTDTHAFVLFGRKDAVAATFDLADIDGTNGFAVGGLAYNERFGYAVSSAGDINGDGFDDVLIGAPGNIADGLSAGRSYVVFGKAGSFTPSIDVTRLDGRDGFEIAPATYGNGNGSAVAKAGDVNGDGLDDLIVSEPGSINDGAPGNATYVVFGRKGDFSPVFDLKAIDGRNGFKVRSPEKNYRYEEDNVGISVASAGDVNGDGFDDIVVGVGIQGITESGGPAARKQATAYVIFGDGKPIGPELRLDSLDGTNGFEIDCGATVFEALDVAVSTAGDFNGDGFADILVGVDTGVSGTSKNYPGKGIIVLGKPGGFTKKVAADGLFAIDDEFGPPSKDRPFSQIYVDVASVGDTNGDGLDDVVIGANGSKYLIYGRDTGRSGIVQVGDDRANTLLGTTGADSLRGLSGNDTYRVDNVGDRVFEAGGGGTDGIVSSVTYTLAAGQAIETLQLAKATGTQALNLTGNEFANTLRGNDGDNILTGGGGNDLLDGGAGIDRLVGGAGDDLYAVDHAGDRVFEAAGQGNDTVVASVTYALQAGQAVETLQLASATAQASLKLFGNEFANTLRGNNGANLLDGGAGIDQLYGKAGDDTYAVDCAEDRVFEAKGEGNDTVVATVSYALQVGQEIETLQFAKSTGTKALKLTGNEFANTLLGNGGDNTLNGLDGADVLSGRDGADTFTFSTKLGGGNVDRITDFASDDTIRLEDSIFAALTPGTLAASAFKNISTGKADADDHILYKQATGQLFYDADGGGKGAALWFATLDNKAALTAADILVV